MTRRASLRAAAAATALATITILASVPAAAPATARPEGPGASPSPVFGADQRNCPLRRVGRQLVHCDNLTGAGVVAPLSVPRL